MANIEGKPCDCAGVSQSAEGIGCSEVPVGKGSRTVDIEMPGELFDRFTTVAKVRHETLGCVARKAVGDYIERYWQDPELRQKARKLAELLVRYKPNPRESK